MPLYELNLRIMRGDLGGFAGMILMYWMERSLVLFNRKMCSFGKLSLIIERIPVRLGRPYCFIKNNVLNI